MVKLLLANGADVLKTEQVVEKAVYHNYIESVPLLIEAGAPINGTPEKYYRPLTIAIRNNHPEIASLLLKLGADPNFPSGEGIPLKLAVTKPEIVKLLLAGGADPTKAEQVIEKAVYHNCIESVPLLVEAGAPINGTPEEYYHPLTTAIRDNHVPILKLLLSFGAEPDMASGENLPIVMAARQTDIERLSVLIEAGADVNKTFRGRSALMVACELNLIENVKLLVQKGADVNAVDDHGNSVMDFAANSGNDEIVMLLLDSMG
ncbi:hypothetical protein G7Y89_g10248 [Cudoniella acicularis]|uniref:Ankyrin n=1 Tax=Cudoniella acicularis TaxID=354080 RepID=A0A8H4RE74_9HELO|nr:hypothetical protein G7Y89_g10248 [Cudoniella acicularis]